MSVFSSDEQLTCTAFFKEKRLLLGCNLFDERAFEVRLEAVRLKHHAEHCWAAESAMGGL